MATENETREKTDIEILSERIDTLRRETKETAKAFSDRCGVNENTLSALKNNRAKAINFDHIKRIANANNVSIDWLIGRTDVREVQQSKDDNESTINYAHLSYGYVYNFLAYLCAMDHLQIVKTSGEITLRVKDKPISEFLDKLQQLARMSVGNEPLCEALKTWVNKMFSNTRILVSGLMLALNDKTILDKYCSAFPWRYEDTIDDYIFCINDAIWEDNSPADIWDENYEASESYDYHYPFKRYYEYMPLCDGIVGYYNHKEPYPAPPCYKVEGSEIVRDFLKLTDEAGL